MSSAPCAQPSFRDCSGEPIATAHAVVNVQLRCGRLILPDVDPGHRVPTVPIRGMHLTKRGGDHFDARVLLRELVDHARERARIELGLRTPGRQ